MKTVPGRKRGSSPAPGGVAKRSKMDFEDIDPDNTEFVFVKKYVNKLFHINIHCHEYHATGIIVRMI